ncbi:MULTISPECIES: C40 family peptidase [unclassified Aureispira]|uniref:C40 family peptidase n=1 Tax=unclassified Aureispira TaxID=2649989 RepID=UPI0006966337|nr:MULTISPECIES: C40 family peptidase [unclassified Aureispira]WMX15825.1 C40 family peptidase [Aureispira sp. CCB-E]
MQKSIINLSIFLVLALALVNSCQSTRSASTSSNSKKVSAETALRESLIKDAEKYKGVKYKYAGKDPRGFDCSGFTSFVCAKHNIKLSSSSTSQSKQGTEIAITKAKPGDLLFFGRNGRNGKIQHVGIVYKNNADGLYMIHSSSKRGIVIDSVTDSKYWKPKLLFAKNVLPLKGKS